MYNKGDRIEYKWKGPWRGFTPGTIRTVYRGIVTVDWDDGSTTRSSIQFINDNTNLLLK